jgi:hypothetical protein
LHVVEFKAEGDGDVERMPDYRLYFGEDFNHFFFREGDLLLEGLAL